MSKPNPVLLCIDKCNNDKCIHMATRDKEKQAIVEGRDIFYVTYHTMGECDEWEKVDDDTPSNK